MKREMIRGVCRNKFFVDDLASTSKCFCASYTEFYSIRMYEMQSNGFHLQLAHCQPPPTPEKGESAQMLYRQGQDAKISCKTSYEYQDGSL